MDFSLVKRDGRDVLLAKGEIELGDEVNYREALSKTPEQAHGARMVYLDSPGGSVSGALAMSEVNDDYMVHMFIPDGADCGSACASILFISGDYRTMAPTGRFGQHSCSFRGVADQECNDLMSEHAVSHGVDFGAIAAIVNYTSPKDVVWFNSAALDCWDITHYPFSAEVGHERSSPCAIEVITGWHPESQNTWRVDLKGNGYRAFARPVADDEHDFQLGLFCDESLPGQMILEFDMTGMATDISTVLQRAHVLLGEGREAEVAFSVDQLDETYTRITMAYPANLTRDVLASSDYLGVRFDVASPYSPINSWVRSSKSRKALLFAANHCMDTAVN
jgi:hypothetical protein